MPAKLIEVPEKLPRSLFNLAREARNYCRDELHIPEYSRIILAVSGGADSTAMAVLMKWLAASFHYELIVLTINHGLREEAEEEARFVQNFSRAINVKCAVCKFAAGKLAFHKKMGLEQAGREGRYALFEYYRRTFNADYVALGHQKHDLSEDVLMRLMRGCGWPALGGMPAKDDGRRLIRPVLWADPDELKNLLKFLKLEWREDPSNRDFRFLRNQVRARFTPLFRAVNPAFDDCMQHLHKFAEFDRAYWEEKISALRAAGNWNEYESEGKCHISFPNAFLLSLPDALRLRLYMYGIKSLGVRSLKASAHVHAKKLLALDKAFTTGKVNKIFQMGAGISAVTGNDCLIFSNNEQTP